jgi:hypothetical protein
MSDKTKIKGMGAIPPAGGVSFCVWAAPCREDIRHRLTGRRNLEAPLQQ